MRIICPECQFTREVDETRIPARAQIATCPKCKVKFQFRELPEEEFAETESVEPETPTTAAASEPETAPETTPEIEPETVRPPESETIPEKPKQQESPKNETPAFPDLDNGSEPHHEEIWDKLGGMTPPDSGEQEPRAAMADEYEPELDSSFGPREPKVLPPFEDMEHYGFFPGFIQTLKRILMSPALFFEVMPLGKGLARPMVFAILVAMIYNVAQFFWGMGGLTASWDMTAADGDIRDLAGGAVLLMMLFYPLFVVMAVFVSAGVHHLLLRTLKAADSGFEATFRAEAYASAPMILGLFPMPTSEVELAWSVLVLLWGSALSVIGWSRLHRTSIAKAAIAAALPLVLGLAAFFASGGGNLTMM
ncbi:YIP1 family protein [Pseudodesulfovibrio tunisiensis]|uniref:YIP1 family protein n=1 Tax=Pseudodesulfovibrio tunisiensis TaxID=463192 RepID=UPI001FB2AAF2|nr:YIP1 family protein [Pseudodesulfovibrio tunisiensis]